MPAASQILGDHVGSTAPVFLSFLAAHAILFDDILYVENALKDKRFADNPVVVGDPKVRFYAGCSLNVNGFKAGTFCVFDKKPRAFTEEDRQLLKDLAILAEQELAISPPVLPV